MAEEYTKLTSSEGQYPAKPEEGQIRQPKYERPQCIPTAGPPSQPPRFLEPCHAKVFPFPIGKLVRQKYASSHQQCVPRAFTEPQRHLSSKESHLPREDSCDMAPEKCQPAQAWTVGKNMPSDNFPKQHHFKDLEPTFYTHTETHIHIHTNTYTQRHTNTHRNTHTHTHTAELS